MSAEAEPAPSVASKLVGGAGLLLALVPVLAALLLTRDGGGYTIDQWGLWAAATLVAAGIAVLAQPTSTLSGVQLLLPLSLLGLAGWTLVSIRWAAWPQSALVDADRYLFYAAATTLVLVAVPTPGWRRLLVAATAAGAALPALILALQLVANSDPAALFASGRLVGKVGYGGGLAAAVAIAFWPLVAFASDRATPRPARPLAAFGAGISLAAVVPTEARASVWALTLSSLVFFALCPTPLRSGLVAASALLPTLALWHQLNGVFATAGAVGAGSVGRSMLAVGMTATVVCAVQVIVDELITLGPTGRRAVAIVATAGAVLALAAGGAVALAATNGHPVGWARHSLQRTVDSVGTESSQAASQGEAGSRFGSLDTGRYDLWKVAVRGFEKQPAKGYGGGNFGYLNVRIGRPFLFPFQAHSQVLEVASSLGFPGLVLYLVVLGLPLGACVWLRLSGLARSEALLAAGAAGGLTYFAAHGQVDWIWQIASCALPAMLLSAAVVGMLPPATVRRRRPLAGGAVALAAIAAAAVLVVPAALAQSYLERSYREPLAQALRDADRADSLDRLSGRPQLAAARALLRNGNTSEALEAARRAAAAEPGYWVAWQMVAITAAREGQRDEAAAALRRVEQLAPRLPLDLRAELPGSGFDHS